MLLRVFLTSFLSLVLLFFNQNLSCLLSCSYPTIPLIINTEFINWSTSGNKYIISTLSLPKVSEIHWSLLLSNTVHLPVTKYLKTETVCRHTYVLIHTCSCSHSFSLCVTGAGPVASPSAASLPSSCCFHSHGFLDLAYQCHLDYIQSYRFQYWLSQPVGPQPTGRLSLTALPVSCCMSELLSAAFSLCGHDERICWTSPQSKHFMQPELI